MIKTLFIGSNWEALATLKTLDNDERFEVVGVITQPDKPVGRKKILTQNEVKKYALSNNMEVFHTENKQENYTQAFEEFKPDLVVVKSFGEMLPEAFLNSPKYGCINIHFSLLPKYRGAVPIQKAILDGQTKTGISIMKMVKEMDKGQILAMYEENIQPTDTNQSLRERLVKKTTEVIGDVLEKYTKGEIELKDQDESQATYCYREDISKEKAQIDWQTMEPEYIERMVRAFIPWPVAWMIHDERRLKIFKAQLIDLPAEIKGLKPGELGEINMRLFVGTKDPKKVIQPLEVQPEGGDRMTGEAFLRGHDL